MIWFAPHIKEMGAIGREGHDKKKSKRMGIVMIGNQIFLDKSVEIEAAGIVNEISAYVEGRYKSGMLRPEFYDNVLLLAAEILPYIEDQDAWIDLGYRLCRDIKQDMEHHGYQHQTAMDSGLGRRCFAVGGFCEQTNLLPAFSRGLKQLLFIAIDHKLERIKHSPTFDRHYDMISGVSGTLYYLLDCDATQEERDILIKGIEYLVSLARDSEFCGRPIIGFHVLQENQNPNFDQEAFKDGSINLGLAHGMLGPLIALSKAYAKGLVVEGLTDGIEKLYRLYETYQYENEANIPYWPDKITVEEYWQGACSPGHLHKKCSWCYGNIGIIRGLQKVAAYMNWPAREQLYIKAMRDFLAQDIKAYNLLSPSLCHGFSSLVAIQSYAYSVYRDPKLLVNLERNVREVIKGYRKSNERTVDLADIRDKRIWVEGYLRDLSLLTGSIGIATTLLSLQGSVRVGRMLMID